LTVTTVHDVQRERLLGALRVQAVADAAGVTLATWGSLTSPRVLPGDAAGYVAGLHRGRLPAVEVYQAGDRWDRQANNGGTINTTWALRVHVPELTKSAAESRARAVLLVALAMLRSDQYMFEGEEEFGAFAPGPLGHSLEVRITLAHTYDRATYETDAVIGPLPPVPGPDPAPTDLVYIAAETVSGGRVVWYDPTAPGWRYADHTTPAHAGVSLAVTLGAIMSGASGPARVYGILEDPAWNWPAPCSLWLGAAGALTPTLPVGGFLREVCRAITPTKIMVEPESAVILL
jgi:hypothetical protein